MSLSRIYPENTNASPERTPNTLTHKKTVRQSINMITGLAPVELLVQLSAEEFPRNRGGRLLVDDYLRVKVDQEKTNNTTYELPTTTSHSPISSMCHLAL